MKKEEIPLLPLQRISATTAIWSFAVGVGLVTPLVIILASLPLPHAADGGAAEQARFLNHLRHPGLLFIKAVVIFPLLEEFFYRGVILQILRRYSPLWFAALFSAAFFGMTHSGQGVATALNALLLGCFFAWLAVRSRSLYPSLLCHSAFNFSWLFLIAPAFGVAEKMLQQPTARSLSPFEIFPIWWVVVSVGLVAVGLRMLAKEFANNEPDKSLPATATAPPVL